MEDITKYELVDTKGGAIRLKRLGDKKNVNKTDVVIIPCFIDTLIQMGDEGRLVGEAHDIYISKGGKN